MDEGLTGSKQRCCSQRPSVSHKAQDQERCALVTRNFGSEPGLSASQQVDCVCNYQRMDGRTLVLEAL